MKTIIEILEGSIPKKQLPILVKKLKKVYIKREEARSNLNYLQAENKDISNLLKKLRKEVETLRTSLEDERLRPFDFISPWEAESEDDSEESKESEKETEKPKEAEKTAEAEKAAEKPSEE